MNIPVAFYSSLKKGNDYIAPDGEIFKNDTLTIDSAEPKSYAYCSDTMFDEMYFEQIRDVTLLYHESTFLHNMLDRALETHHTTALQAGEVAKLTGAKKLIIGHFSARYKTLVELLEEAQSVFPDTELAIEGRLFVIGE